MGAAVLRSQFALHPLHGGPEILVRPGPARRIDPGSAAKGRHDEPRIIGKRHHAACPAAARALSTALSSNVAPVSVGLGEAERPAPTARTPKGASNASISAILPGLWLAMTSCLPASRRRAIRHDRPSAARWAFVNSAMPRRASASISPKWVSSNGAPSAVAWISTNPPDPVSTKLASVCAWESSA